MCYVVLYHLTLTMRVDSALMVQCLLGLCVFCWCLQSSRNLLLELSRQLLCGEGDVTRHLGYIGYSVTYEQVCGYCAVWYPSVHSVCHQCNVLKHTCKECIVLANVVMWDVGFPLCVSPQTALQEFDYTVTNLATDLRDGLRLTSVCQAGLSVMIYVLLLYSMYNMFSTLLVLQEAN